MARPSVDPSDQLPRDPASVALRAFVAARRRGDRAAMKERWQVLLEVEWPRVQNLIALKRHEALPGGRVPAEDRDELAQKVYLRLHDWLELEGSSIGEFRAILKQAVTWTFLDHVREHVADDVGRAGSLDEQDDAGEGEAAFVRRIEEELAAHMADGFEQAGQAAALAGAMNDLEERQRTVVVLRLAGHPSKEVAERLGLTPSNVDQIHSRGLARLRAALRDHR